MIKLIVTDMDGTFLDDNHMVDENFWPLYEKLKEMGVVFGCASGRQFYTLQDNFLPIKDEIAYIAENGTYTYYKGKELLVDSIHRDKVLEVLKKLEEIDDAHPVLCGKESAYIEEGNEEFVKEVQMYYKRCEIVEDLKEVEDEFLKIAVYAFSDIEKNIFPHFKDDIKKYKITVSGMNWMDIAACGSNKGKGIEKLQELIGATKEETMAFGDYLNDLEMLEDAYYSFAMKEAHPKLKEVAKEVIGCNTEGAVVKTIKEVLNID